MLTSLVLLIAGSAAQQVPTAGAVALHTDAVVLTRVLLAQAEEPPPKAHDHDQKAAPEEVPAATAAPDPDPDADSDARRDAERDAERVGEERRLEADMDRARRHLGDDEEDSGRAKRRRIRRDRYREVPDDEWIEDEPAPGHRRYRKRRPGYLQPTIEGSGKTYYMVWGIVDWVLAGSFWVGATVAGVAAIAIGANADNLADYDTRDRDSDAVILNSHRMTRKERADVYRDIAAGYGVVSVGLGIAGGILAWRGNENFGKMRQLREIEQQRDRARYDPHVHERDSDFDD